MNSKELRNIVLSKYQNGDTPTDIPHDLNGGISLATIKRWYQMIYQSGSIQLLGTRDGPRIVRALTRIYEKLKTVGAENRKYQLVNF